MKTSRTKAPAATPYTHVFSFPSAQRITHTHTHRVNTQTEGRGWQRYCRDFHAANVWWLLMCVWCGYVAIWTTNQIVKKITVDIHIHQRKTSFQLQNSVSFPLAPPAGQNEKFAHKMSQNLVRRLQQTLSHIKEIKRLYV